METNTTTALLDNATQIHGTFGERCSVLWIWDGSFKEIQACGPFSELQLVQIEERWAYAEYMARIRYDIDTYNVTKRESVERMRDDNDPLWERSFYLDACVRHLLVCEGGTGESLCDEMDSVVDSWLNTHHADAPGLRECVLLARENAANVDIPPWMGFAQAQEGAWKDCARLESILRYVEVLGVYMGAAL